jgi:hypothetical protein
METPSVRQPHLSLSLSDQDQESTQPFSLSGWPRPRIHNIVRHFYNRLGHCSQK